MKLKQLIPNPVKTALKRLVPTSFIDQMELLTGERDLMTPPSRLMFTGDGDFVKVGNATVDSIRKLVGLHQTDHILDVGSGIGRVAVPLTHYIQPPGRYSGIEIVKAGVYWCQRIIQYRFPYFHFYHLHVYNRLYNPQGVISASEVRFPFEPATFDLAVLNSVFTHMLEADFEHYLSELSRVLKKGGRAYITIFLLNEESRRLNAEEKTVYGRFLPPFTERAMVHLPNEPEAMIAFDEAYVQSAFREAGLTIQAIQYGYWPGRTPETDTYQDILCITR